MLDIERIGVSFPGFSLSSVSLKVEAGDYLALLGVSGWFITATALTALGV